MVTAAVFRQMFIALPGARVNGDLPVTQLCGKHWSAEMHMVISR
ncbi:KRUF family protein [Toxoplasma gondii VEG]|uniref:KRUF family protein n=2 Tax=Toxoplasma gondii TaxID=5811 RepID=V4YXW4_TOXGV|nr:KRUF family protein [Toxoplasma gondii VEG]